MYFTLYNLLFQFIYGDGVVLTEWMDLTLTMMSTLGVLFVVVIPFVIIGIAMYVFFNVIAGWFK